MVQAAVTALSLRRGGRERDDSEKYMEGDSEQENLEETVAAGRSALTRAKIDWNAAWRRQRVLEQQVTMGALCWRLRWQAPASMRRPLVPRQNKA